MTFRFVCVDISVSLALPLASVPRIVHAVDA
jgi:hypothetical protein